MPAALRLFVTSFLRALPFALIPIVLLLVLAGFGYVTGDEGDADDGTWALYLIVVILLISPALLAPLIFRIHAIAHARPVTAGQAWRRGARGMLPCLAGAALYLVAVSAGSVLLLLPGLYLLVALSFWWLALVADELPVLDALKVSLRLTRGHWWHVVLAFGYVFPIVYWTNKFDVDMVSLPNETAEMVIATLLSVLVSMVVPMFVSANMVVVHHDLVLRRTEN